MRRFDLRSLRFGRRQRDVAPLPVEVEPFVFGGLDYDVPDGVVDLLLTRWRASATTSRSTLRSRPTSHGPCQRCLADADVAVQARGIEYVRHGESERGETRTRRLRRRPPVDLERWVRDLIAEALPRKLLCREDCRGPVPVCGADLNADPDHRHEEA